MKQGYAGSRKNRRKRRRTRFSIEMKLLMILAGGLFLLIIFGKALMELFSWEEVKGETLAAEDAGILTELLVSCAKENGLEPEGGTEAVLDKAEELKALGQEQLLYYHWKELTELLPASEYEIPVYRSGSEVPEQDFYQFFDAARQTYDIQGTIKDLDLTVLAAGEDALDNDGNRLGEEELVAVNGRFSFVSDKFLKTLLKPVTAIAKGDRLYTVRDVKEDDWQLANVWVMENLENRLRIFWNNYEIFIAAPGITVKKETVSDLSFKDGKLDSVAAKEEKVSGRLLKVDGGGADIEGSGYLPFADELKIYKLYGKMESYHTDDLKIGYAFTDFVIADGKIQAALVTKEEQMEYIRVLIKTSGFGGAYHDRIQVQADCDCRILTGEYGKEQEQILGAGEVLEITPDSPLFTADRIKIEPLILTGKISLLNVNRSQGTPSYRGSFELEKTENGIVAVNEVLLEEYLYAVVPSEMPASYPIEALKAQAVCARTYAYAKMERAGLANYGAHVDDSAGFQVYNNIEENAETSKAVRETKGQVLYYEEELAETYYYSTSCGFGSNVSVWLSGDTAKYPYLLSKSISENPEETEEALAAAENTPAVTPLAKRMEEEENFSGFISQKGEQDYEKEEPWYRWTYETKLDVERLNQNIRRRYEAGNHAVLTLQEDGTFASQTPVDTGKIRNMQITRRGPGGVAAELLIEGENSTVLVKTEHNIRYVLSNQTQEVIRQDGSSADASSMIPSAFTAISVVREGDYVVGYSLIGGGFGHGVGMSQNGAKNMAASGKDSSAILTFFYDGCEIHTIY